jgi:hypothetical protein
LVQNFARRALEVRGSRERCDREPRARVPVDVKGGSDIVNLAGVAVVDAQEEEEG